MTDALDRVIARAAAPPPAAPQPPVKEPAVPNPPPVPVAPVAPPPPPPPPPVPEVDTVDLADQVGELQDQVKELTDRLQVLEQAAVDEALSGMDMMMSPGDPMMAMAALGLIALDEAGTPHLAADFSQAQRDKLADKGAAMKDGSFPIRNQADLSNALQALGRAKNPDAVKSHIRKRAAALGLMDYLHKHAGWMDNAA